MPRRHTIFPVEMQSASQIYTVGYAHRSMLGLIELMQQHRIEFLIDVRSKPTSRFQPEFDQESLDCHASAAGIRYVFMGDTLGGRPDDPTCYQNGHVLYERVRQRDFFDRGLQRLLNAASGMHRVCLLCMELKPETCHRSKLIGTALADHNLQVLHIDADGSLASQDDVIRRLDGPQGELFDERFQSRKSYPARHVKQAR